MTVQFKVVPIQEIAVGTVVRRLGRVSFVHDTGASIALFFGQSDEPLVVPKSGDWTAEVVDSA